MSRSQDYITTVRELARVIWNSTNELQALQFEWNALQYGTTLENGEGLNEGINKEEIGPVVFAFANSLRQVMDGTTQDIGANAGNVCKVL